LVQIQIIKNKYQIDEQFPPLSFFFVDDNVWGDVNYAKALLQSLAPLKISWSTQGSLTLDDELLKLAAEGGCKSLFVGFESLDIRNLDYFNKNHNKPELYEACIAKLHRAGIAVTASFMLGLPYDNEDCFDTLLNFLEKNSVDFGFVNIYTPVPGTRQFNQRDWKGAQEAQDMKTIAKSLPVFAPPNMSKKQFRHNFIKLQRKLFSDESIDKILRKYTNPASYFPNI